MNLELDLGLDSLARTECAVVLEIDPEEAATALTVGELIALAATKQKEASDSPTISAARSVRGSPHG